MTQRAASLLIGVLVWTAAALPAQQQPRAESNRWTEERAKTWYANQPWLVGSNYIPADAINELEMWQAGTFDPKRIDMELSWAEGLGMTTMRVFLHDLLWKQDSEGFKKRIDAFLEICDKHKIRPLFVLFDSCWDPYPHLGKQRAPSPGVHNSGWVQSPGDNALEDATQYPRLEAYVKGIVGAFGHDKRVLAWDVWNEPDNTNDNGYGLAESPRKVRLVLALLPQAFEWARAEKPEQPLTSGVWHGDWSAAENLAPMAKEQLDLSDVISFHNYAPPADFEQHVLWLKQYGRPLICTEYMARPEKSTFQGTLPIAKKYKVGAINWGFAAGKTQTYLPWDSWEHPYIDRPPALWFHEIFHEDGVPYLPTEVVFIRKMTGKTD
ncbi:MAG: cellulase family glycosylhydrolase [Acidobacteriaceae bacterium]|nr:cellulase family glycosylhydrolase [Acidobacteriaceae bacterium]MBV9778624.1 cellulase family glycosylhydrolase [Acidobacteriaceae bacterium]